MEINMLQALSNFKTNSVEVKGNGTEGDFLKSLNNLINSEEFNGEENIEAENIPNVKVDIEELLNIEFNEENSRETRYDAYACNDYFNKLEAQNRPRLCGLCIKVCPWGLVNKKSRKKRNLI